VAKNYIKRLGGEQVRDLRGIAVFQRNPLCNSGFPRGTLREIQHGYRTIQQRDMKAKSRQAHRQGAGTAPQIQSAQRPRGLGEKVLQIGQGEVEAQLALGRLKVGGVLRCAGPEPFAVVIGGHFLHGATPAKPPPCS
jgi:hypothetical protein